MACLTLASSHTSSEPHSPHVNSIRHVNQPLTCACCGTLFLERIVSYSVPRLLQACLRCCQWRFSAHWGDTLWHLAVVRGSVVALVVPVLAVLPGEDTISLTCA